MFAEPSDLTPPSEPERARSAAMLGAILGLLLAGLGGLARARRRGR